MNITEELNNIIIKYQLDRHYPRFQKKLKAEKIIKKVLIKDVEENRKILLVGTRPDDVYFTKSLVKQCENVEGTVILDEKSLELRKEIVDIADKIYLVSFHMVEDLMLMLDKHQIKYTNMYDIFLTEGLYLEDEWYHLLAENSNKEHTLDPNGIWVEKLQWEFLYQYNRFQKAEFDVLKKIAAEKMLFLSLICKNFIQAEQCKARVLELGTDLLLKETWEEIQTLLNKIKNIVQKRKQKDIILYWMDAVSFEESADMAFLNEIIEKSVSFQNAFTMTPQTRPTFWTLLCEKTAIKDNCLEKVCFRREAGGTLLFLEKEGYDIKIISNRYGRERQGLEPRFTSGWNTAFSENVWAALEELVNNKNRQFLLVHGIPETHQAFDSFQMCFDDWRTEVGRRRAGKKEMDEQLKFYHEFFGNHAVQIFMSDHGVMRELNQAGFHIHMNIYSSEMKPRKVHQMFSILDFCKLVKQIVRDNEIEESAFDRRYVPIEGLDAYAPDRVQLILKLNRIWDTYFFGFKGVITKDYIYLRYSNGQEWFSKRGIGEPHFEWREPKYLPEEQEILEQMRLWAGEYPLEELQKTKLGKFSPYIHEIYHVYREKASKILELLEEMLAEYDENSIAIRMGGKHSYELYRILTEDSQKKILGFIDSNEKCICASYEKEIIPLDNLGTKGIKGVVLSSYDYLDMLREESLSYPADIKCIDMYKIFEEHGYKFTRNFYVTMGVQEEDCPLIHELERVLSTNE